MLKINIFDSCVYIVFIGIFNPTTTIEQQLQFVNFKLDFIKLIILTISQNNKRKLISFRKCLSLLKLIRGQTTCQEFCSLQMKPRCMTLICQNPESRCLFSHHTDPSLRESTNSSYPQRMEIGQSSYL